MGHLREKTLLVTGGAGFIGCNFVGLAARQGYRILILDALTYAGHRENIPQISGENQPELIVGNICDSHLVPSLLREYQVDGVINFAAESHVDRSIDGPAAFIETNIGGTFNLVSSSFAYWQSLTGEKKENFRYLQISTDEVYGSLGPTGKFSETTAYAPNSPYSASKAAADHLVRAWYHTYGLPTLTTHCSNNYGPYQYPEKLIPTLIESALNDRPLPIYGDGMNIRDWIHVEDHCRGVLLVFEKAAPGSTYCIGGQAERTNLDVVREICRQLDQLRPRKDGQSHSTRIQFVKDRLGHDRRYAIDDQLICKELGFQRKYGFQEGLASTIQWYLDHSDWVQAVLKSSS